jgi:hypothetical protein
MVGDRSVDMLAAHRNGLRAAGVLWGHGSREELLSEQPEYLFQSPNEIASLGASTAIFSRARHCSKCPGPQLLNAGQHYRAGLRPAMNVRHPRLGVQRKPYAAG